METKVCSKCKLEKQTIEFNKYSKTKDGLQGSCRECQKQKSKEWKENNQDKIKEKNKTYYHKNKETKSVKNKLWAKENKDKIKQYRKKYNDNNKEARKELNKNYLKSRLDNDPLFKMRFNIRIKISEAIRKLNRTEVILGCSIIEFKSHLESQFQDWMNWDNYGKYNGDLNHGWDIDHIIPISSAKTEEDIIKLNHYTNLRPLCSYTNRYIKKNKIDI